MSDTTHDNGHQSSRDIYEALSQHPLHIETVFTLKGTHAPHRFNQTITLNPNDRHTIDLIPPDTSPNLHLTLTSSLALLPSSSSNACIRTLELSFTPTSPSSPSSDPAFCISLESFCASTDLILSGKTLLANGYQSWSTSYAGADDGSVFQKPNWFYNELTHLGLASDMHIYEYPGVKGKVHSNLVTIIRDKCVEGGGGGKEGGRPEEVVLCGGLSEDGGYTYFLMDFNLNKFAVSQDCVGKQSSTQHQLSGWTSWYLHYENINEHIILENLHHFSGSGRARPSSHITDNDIQRGEGWPAKVFQIDDGYTIVGDWLDVDRHKFPRGMPFIAEEIRNKGLVPGLWMAPFLASKKANVVRDHPDWFVQKPATGKHAFEGGQNSNVDEGQHRQGLCCCCPVLDNNDTHARPNPSDLMLAHPAFGAGAFALDLENPTVQTHLANIFRVVTQEWGFKMLKLDFLFAAALLPRNGKSRGQLMWEAMQMIRTWAGPDIILLGCGVPLGASFMLVDYCRIGCDVGAAWDTMQRYFHDREYISCFNSLTSTLSRWAMSGRFFGNDPDVFFLRDWKMGLSSVERRTLMLLNHLLGHLVFCSDPFEIARMSPDQREALGAFFPWPSTPDTPLPPFEIVRVLQPVSDQKNFYMIQVQSRSSDHDRTFIIVANLSSRKQHVHLSIIERIVAKEQDSLSPKPKDAVDAADARPSSQAQAHARSVYFQPQPGQFGSSASAYMIQPHETCVFLRVVDSLGRPCGPAASLVRAGYSSAALETISIQEPVYLLATSGTGGHILPTTEIERFERHAKLQHQLTVAFRPSYFEKTITVWVAWKSLPKEEDKDKDKDGLVKNMTLNGQSLQLHPNILRGSGINVASCSLPVSPSS
ncbi:hypothetical protein BGZ54_008640 [Gamsiella multidivaricata]|nr:hypothetical protein BGZ54_008640 [Gamsiella multidivaricata]